MRWTPRESSYTRSCLSSARSAGPVQNTGPPPVYRPRSRSAEGTFPVSHHALASCWQLLAAGSDLPGGGTKASGIREAKAVVVRFGDTADHIGVAVRAVLGGHFVCASAADTGRAGAFGQAVWHHKTHPTFFSDGLALVRKELWAHGTFCESSQQTDTVKVPRAFVERLTDAVCYAAWWLKSSTKGDLGNPDHRI